VNSKILDLIILVLSLLFFIGLLAFEYRVFGLENSILSIPDEFKEFFEFLIWPILILLTLDLVLKYRKINNPKKFVKKYWIDILMLALIPIFSIFKFLKIGLSLIKQLKTIKMGAKIFHKTKKIYKKT
jgi:predicted small integral membrane protein